MKIRNEELEIRKERRKTGWVLLFSFIISLFSFACENRMVIEILPKYGGGEEPTYEGPTHEEPTYEGSTNEGPTYAVTMQNDGNGTATASPNPAKEGDKVTISAAPEVGYVFKEWQIVSGGVPLSGATTNSATFTMPGNAVTIKALFQEIYVSFTITDNDKTYNGVPQYASVEYDGITADEAGLLTVIYRDEDDEVVTEPINAGVYGIYVTTMGGTKYAAISEPVSVEILTINPKPLTITSAAHTKPYDRTNSAYDVGSVTFDGIIAGDESAVSADTVTAAYTNVNAGTKTINITAITLTGAASGNYTVTLPVSVTVEGITKADPVVTWPSGLQAYTGQVLSNISLTGQGTSTPAGTFTWTKPSNSVGAVGTQSHNMTFTPNNTTSYNILTQNVTITVIKADPVVKWPSGLEACFWYTLADITLPENIGGTEGVFAWTADGSTSVGGLGTQSHNMTFTPDNTDNYNIVNQNVGITVRLMETVWIPAGSFIMGSPASEPNRDPASENQVSVTLTQGFYMGKYEVTQGQWDAVMDNKFATISGGVTSYGVSAGHPVYCVTWYDALEFCDKLSELEGLEPVYNLTGIGRNTYQNITSATVNADFNNNGYRLPTEAQWEYACRGDYPNKATETNTKPFGILDGTKMVPGMANFDTHYPYDLARGGTYNEPSGPVYFGQAWFCGQFPPNNYGLYDMHGNVWEWCYDSSYQFSGNIGGVDPVGVSGYGVVLRGGGWDRYGQRARSAYRFCINPVGEQEGFFFGIYVIGFRLVRP